MCKIGYDLFDHDECRMKNEENGVTLEIKPGNMFCFSSDKWTF